MSKSDRYSPGKEKADFGHSVGRRNQDLWYLVHYANILRRRGYSKAVVDRLSVVEARELIENNVPPFSPQIEKRYDPVATQVKLAKIVMIAIGILWAMYVSR